MDLGIVIFISKFPNLCHDMKAYPRIWCMNAYPIIQLSYLQCPGDIIISDFGKNEKNLISCNKISSVKLYLNNWCYNDWCIIYKSRCI